MDAIRKGIRLSLVVYILALFAGCEHAQQPSKPDPWDDDTGVTAEELPVIHRAPLEPIREDWVR